MCVVCVCVGIPIDSQRQPGFERQPVSERQPAPFGIYKCSHQPGSYTRGSSGQQRRTHSFPSPSFFCSDSVSEFTLIQFFCTSNSMFTVHIAPQQESTQSVLEPNYAKVVPNTAAAVISLLPITRITPTWSISVGTSALEVGTNRHAHRAETQHYCRHVCFLCKSMSVPFHLKQKPEGRTNGSRTVCPQPLRTSTPAANTHVPSITVRRMLPTRTSVDTAYVCLRGCFSIARRHKLSGRNKQKTFVNRSHLPIVQRLGGTLR